MGMKRIAVFASGSGSNAENLIRYFLDGTKGASVVLVVCNRPDAGVIGRAEALGVDIAVMPRADINDPSKMLPLLESHGVDAIVLAGFLLMVPAFIIERYPGRIINIHPSLLPKFGGKGMYGAHVHRAVVEAGETRTGITIHLVSEQYDEGAVMFQASTEVKPGDTPEDVERKVRQLEMEHFPRAVRDIILTPTTHTHATDE